MDPKYTPTTALDPIVGNAFWSIWEGIGIWKESSPQKSCWTVLSNLQEFCNNLLQLKLWIIVQLYTPKSHLNPYRLTVSLSFSNSKVIMFHPPISVQHRRPFSVIYQPAAVSITCRLASHSTHSSAPPGYIYGPPLISHNTCHTKTPGLIDISPIYALASRAWDEN